MTQTQTAKFGTFKPMADFNAMPKLTKDTPPPADTEPAHNGNGHKEPEQADNCFLLDLKEGYAGPEYVNPDRFPKDKQGEPVMGRQWRYDNQLLYLVAHRKNDTWAVVEPPDKPGKTTPDGLYSALNPPGVEEVFGLPKSLLEKMGTVALYVLIGVALFFGYMMSQQKPHNTGANHVWLPITILGALIGMMHRPRNFHSAVRPNQGPPSGGGGLMDMTTYSELPSAIKTLTDPGKDLQHLLMRCCFRDEKQMHSFVVLYWWAFQQAAGDSKSEVLQVVDMLHDWAAASDSIQAERTKKVVESIIGQHRPSGLKRAFGFHRKEQVTAEE